MFELLPREEDVDESTPVEMVLLLAVVVKVEAGLNVTSPVLVMRENVKIHAVIVDMFAWFKRLGLIGASTYSSCILVRTVDFDNEQLTSEWIGFISSEKSYENQ